MIRVAWVALVVLSLARVAVADEPPWARGVSEAQKATAQRLLGEGNELFVQSKYREALERYQQAIAAWDHPSIRFNMARALIALDRPLDAYEAIEKALAYGKEPLEDQFYTEAINYRTLLEKQIATVEVTCTQARVAISLDGAPLLTCPGTKSMRTTPGNHEIVGKLTGYLTSTVEVVAMPGKKLPIAIALKSAADATVMRSRWAAWKPWAVAGGGGGLAGLGGLLDLKAKLDLDAFQQDLAKRCAHTGCTPSQLGSQETTAIVENRIAIGAMVVGAAAVATGITLVILNRPRAFVPKEQVVPTATPGGAGVALVGSF
jgi:tetratricopeptide (TPR) repeat protein